MTDGTRLEAVEVIQVCDWCCGTYALKYDGDWLCPACLIAVRDRERLIRAQRKAERKVDAEEAHAAEVAEYAG